MLHTLTQEQFLPITAGSGLGLFLRSCQNEFQAMQINGLD